MSTHENHQQTRSDKLPLPKSGRVSSLEQLCFALDCSPATILLCDEKGDIIYANRAASLLLDYSNNELLTLTIADVDLRPELTNLKLFYSEMNDGRQESLIGTELKRKNGTTIFVESITRSYECDKKKIICHVFNKFPDNEDQIHSNVHLGFLINSGNDAVYIFDSRRTIIYVNDIACAMTGYARDELIGSNLKRVARELKGDVADIIVGQDKSGYKNLFESRHYRKDGSVIPVEIANAVSSINGKQYVVAFARDISDRKKRQQEMEELQFVLENASDAVYLYKKNGDIYYVNNSACMNLGYSKEELQRMNLADIDPSYLPEYRKEAWLDNSIYRLPPLQTVHIRKDGTSYPVEISTTTAMSGNEKIGASFARDLTERIKAQRQLYFTQLGSDSAAETILYHDKDARITYANKTACKMLGYSMEELLSMKILQIGKTVNEETWPHIWNQVLDGETHTFVDHHIRKDGTEFPVEVTSRVHNFDGELIGCTVTRDVTERMIAQNVLAESEERFRLIADTSPVVLILSRAENAQIIYANKQAEILFGKSSQQLSQLSVAGLFDRTDLKYQILDIHAKGKQIEGFETILERKGRSTVWLSISARCIELQGEKVICSAMQDITEAKELANKLSYHATYDSLTGLVNRREFELRLKQLIDDSAVSAKLHALCFLDLDQFKIINDTCGHIAGDELLRQLANVFQAKLRREDTIARLGGDEFGILLQHCELKQAESVADHIRKTVMDFRFVWQGNSFTLGVSIGLVLVGHPGDTVTDILRRADAACYAAKDSGRNRIHLYSADDDELAERQGQMQWVSRIAAALDANRFQLWRQTIMPIRGNAEKLKNEVRYELLVRMVDESGDTIPPGAFLPAAERYDLAPKIDRWVINKAFAWFANFPEETQKLTSCSINLSGQSLSDSQLLEEIIELFRSTRIPPEKICFEITETAAITNLSHATQFMTSLKNLGCRFALDDFGSGLSSFAYLKTLPVDLLKIDGLFVKDILNDPIDLAMVKAINDMGHAMGKKTIAEFVENEEILEQLKKLGIDYAQGYGISKPEPLYKISFF